MLSFSSADDPAGHYGLDLAIGLELNECIYGPYCYEEPVSACDLKREAGKGCNRSSPRNELKHRKDNCQYQPHALPRSDRSSVEGKSNRRLFQLNGKSWLMMHKLLASEQPNGVGSQFSGSILFIRQKMCSFAKSLRGLRTD